MAWIPTIAPEILALFVMETVLKRRSVALMPQVLATIAPPVTLIETPPEPPSAAIPKPSAPVVVIEVWSV